jgi:hypothetical protein
MLCQGSKFWNVLVAGKEKESVKQDEEGLLNLKCHSKSIERLMVNLL